MASCTPAFLSHVWWRNYITSHLGLEPDMEWGSCDWCPLQNHERSLVPGCQESRKVLCGGKKKKDVLWLSETLRSNLSPTWQRETGRERYHWLLATWRARSGADVVRKVMYLPPLRLYPTWLGGGHTVGASALNTNDTLDTKPIASGFGSLYSYLWNED